MRDAEKALFRSTVPRNVGRSRRCGRLIELPCRVCNHPVTRTRELVAAIRRGGVKV